MRFLDKVHYPLTLVCWQYEVVYTISEPTDELDMILCEMVAKKGGSIPLAELARLLGFSVVTHAEEGSYADPGELAIFRYYLQTQYSFHLLSEKMSDTTEQPVIVLTHWGWKALAEHSKEKFYKQPSYRVYTFRDLAVDGNLTFGTYFNLVNDLAKGSLCNPDDFVAARLKQHELAFENQQIQANHNGNQSNTVVYSTTPGQAVGLTEISIECDVWQCGPDTYQLNVQTVGAPNDRLTTILLDSRNRYHYDAIIKKAQFQALLNDPEAVFNSETIAEFSTEWNWLTLVDDPRMDWSDPAILIPFQEQNQSVWNRISHLTPTGSIQAQLTDFRLLWDWTVLSERLDDGFVIQHIDDELCPWDFNALSIRGSRFIQQVLPITNQTGYQPRWNLTGCQGSFPDEFILRYYHPNTIYDYEQLESRGWRFTIDLLVQATAFNVRPPFNYSLFTRSALLSELLLHLKLLAPYLDWKVLIERVCQQDSSILAEPTFLKLLQDNSPRTLAFTLEELDWTESLIRLLDELGLIRWRSFGADFGFECNPHVRWTPALFEAYHQRIQTPIGYAHLSSTISSPALIRLQPDFNWDWVKLALNSHFLIDDTVLDDFAPVADWQALSAHLPEMYIISRLERYRNWWNWEILSDRLQAQVISYSLSLFPWNFERLSGRSASFLDKVLGFDKALQQNWNWIMVADQVSETTLINLLPHLGRLHFSDEQKTNLWSTVSRRMPTEYMILHVNYPWEWSHVTRTSTKEQLIPKLEELKEKWDWAYLTATVFEPEEIENLCQEKPLTSPNWDWTYLLEKVYTPTLLQDRLTATLEAISQVEKGERRQNIWSALTRKVGVDCLYEKLMPMDDGVQVTLDWSYLSQQTQFPWDNFSFIDRYLIKWDWEQLSRNKRVNNKYRCLLQYQDYWDWSYLSENSSFIFNELIDFSTKQKLDRESFLDRRKRNRDRLIKLKKHIDWLALSRRLDLRYDIDLLVLTDRWDYQALSDRRTLKITNDYLIENAEKEWSWAALTKHPDLIFYDEKGKGLLAEEKLLNKAWDWSALTNRPDICFTYDLINRTKDKPWDYRRLTSLLFTDVKITRQLLGLLGDKPLNWDYLSENTKFDELEIQTDAKQKSVLALFRGAWNWHIISRVGKLGNLLQQPGFIEEYADQWDYYELSHRPEIARKPDLLCKLRHKPWDWAYLSGVIEADALLLDELKTYLDWSKLSSSTVLNVTEDLLIRFKQYWNWHELITSRSRRIEDDVWGAANKLLNQDSRLLFLSRLDAQQSIWKGYIYHYTHLENAASILNEGRIKSRHQAIFKDSASQQIVYRRLDPHQFARFYFRPQTPYQYYTERLGREFGDYKQIEYPKCPVPIFFRIKLSEVLFDEDLNGRYYITSDNFHADATVERSIDQAVHYFDYKGVYRTFSSVNGDLEVYKRQIQQEFVVYNGIDINRYQSLQVLCETPEDAQSLINKLKEPTKWFDKINIGWGHYYMNHNSAISIIHHESLLRINLTNPPYTLKGKIKLTVEKGGFRLIDSGAVLKDELNSITVIGWLEAEIVDNQNSFNVCWIDESEKSWEVYCYKGRNNSV